MVVLYVIQSSSDNYRYVGITNNIRNRLVQHNKGKSLSTKSHIPFKLIHVEEYRSYKEAREKEIFLKSGVGRKYLDSLKSTN